MYSIKNKIQLTYFTIIFLLFTLSSFAQKTDSCHIRISVITCGPGQELYSLFGHTALRIIDSTNHTDIVYNWGTFDFDEPNFYVNFMRGQLNYFISAWNFPDFMYEYEQEQRNVYEQKLMLSCLDKQKIVAATLINMQGSNRYYKYDFLLDNCTNRVRDIILKQTPQTTFPLRTVDSGTTARNMIHYYLDRGGQPWSKLGIDILLGSKLDKPVSNMQSMFLPEFYMQSLDHAQYNDQPVCEKSKTILTATPLPNQTGQYTPLIFIASICLIIFLLSISNLKPVKKITHFLDVFLLCISGLLGSLLLFMWFGTDHTVCKTNWNLLWALPTNLIAGFFYFKKPNWLKKYFMFVAVITAALIAGWFWLPQQMNIALAPIALLMMLRYFKLATT